MKTGHGFNDIPIICSYAHYISYGEIEIEIDKYRHDLNNTMCEIPNSYIKIGMEDNNGQINQKESQKNLIGKWTLSNKTDAGNGENYIHACKRQNMACMNTFIRPKWKIKSRNLAFATW